ncbi:hypothetical protein MRX96_027361 [Rhipicephalus microplus]
MCIYLYSESLAIRSAFIGLAASPNAKIVHSDTACLAYGFKEAWSTSPALTTRRPIKELDSPWLTFVRRCALIARIITVRSPTAVRGRQLLVLGEAVTRGRAAQVGNAVIEAASWREFKRACSSNSKLRRCFVEHRNGRPFAATMEGRERPRQARNVCSRLARSLAVEGWSAKRASPEPPTLPTLQPDRASGCLVEPLQWHLLLHCSCVLMCPDGRATASRSQSSEARDAFSRTSSRSSSSALSAFRGCLTLKRGVARAKPKLA